MDISNICGCDDDALCAGCPNIPNCVLPCRIASRTSGRSVYNGTGLPPWGAEGINCKGASLAGAGTRAGAGATPAAAIPAGATPAGAGATPAGAGAGGTGGGGAGGAGGGFKSKP